MICKDIIILKNFVGVNHILEFNFPIPLKIQQDKEKTYFYIEYEKIGLFVISEKFEDILDMTTEAILYIWKEYVDNNTKDEKLTSTEAEIIRRNLEFYCTKRFIFNTDIN